jgi:hypothetical protein
MHMIGAHEKMRSAMTSRTSSTAISLVAFFGFSSVLCAQQAKTPTLQEILQRLEASAAQRLRSSRIVGNCETSTSELTSTDGT